MKEWIFIRIADAKEREYICGLLAKNNYEVRFKRKRQANKQTYIYGIEYRESDDRG